MRALWFAVGLGLMLGPTAPGAHTSVVKIRIHYSQYSPARIEVRAGDTVRFVITNDDPIAHEFILGSATEQAAHERLRTKTHDGVPGQASLSIGETQTVVFTFGAPGTVLYACHVPGHYAYGMVGVIRVS